MAGSRIEKLGTVFTRVQGLLRTGAMKQADKPLWYDVYAAFPPRIEPKYDRPVVTREPREILYEEDSIRAMFYKTFASSNVIDMTRQDDKTVCQRFIHKHGELRTSNPGLNEEDLFSKVVEVLKTEEGISLKTHAQLLLEREMSKKQQGDSSKGSISSKSNIQNIISDEL